MVYNSYIKNGTRWLINGISPDVLREICDVIHTNNGEVIRNGYYKKVLRYLYYGESFYIKQYTTKGFLEGVKSLFSLSKAYREWTHSHRLLKSHLLTAEPVAVGEKRRFGILKDCYVISKAIPNSTTVKAFLSIIQKPSTSALQKKTFMNNLISYVRTVHNLGIFHGELHAENILVKTDNPASFYLLDVGRALFKKKLPLPFRIHELSRLLYSIIDICTHDEITGLIDKYADQLLPNKEKDIFRTIVLKKIYKIKHRLWQSRTRKCLKTNNVFTVTTYAGYTVNKRNEWDVSTLAALIDRHLISFKEQPDMVIKSSAKTGITRIAVSHESIKSVCIKEHRYPSALKRFFYSFRNSPARRAWLAAHGLMAANFLTPKPIALFEEKRFARVEKSFVIMEELSRCLPCNKYVSENFSDPYDKTISGKKKRFISCLATSFKHLHDSGIYHSDLKANNIMIRELPETWDFFYLDLDRVSFQKKIAPKEKMKNLAQLNASIPHCITYTDRLRFYQTYADIKDFAEADKQILRAIVRLSIQRKHIWNPNPPISK
ncbi:MAG: hypothetical protein F9K48_00160 [Candidatus Brocadia sp.]|nr:MAG: hypothetical protein F9K48_00160 [Candidatus Brocadia sp.]